MVLTYASGFYAEMLIEILVILAVGGVATGIRGWCGARHCPEKAVKLQPSNPSAAACCWLVTGCLLALLLD